MYYCAPRRGPVSRDASPAQYYRPSTAGPVPGTSATIPPWAGHWDPGAGIADPAPSRRGGPAACRSVSCRSLSGTFGAVPRPAWNDAVARGLSLMNTPSPRPRRVVSLMTTPSRPLSSVLRRGTPSDLSPPASTCPLKHHNAARSTATTFGPESSAGRSSGARSTRFVPLVSTKKYALRQIRSRGVSA